MRGPVAIACAAVLLASSVAAAGGLMVTCWPGHTVSVDGAEVGVTTVEQDGLLLMDVAPGVRSVRVERDGFMPFEATVEVPDTGLVELKVPRLEPALGVLRVTGEVGWRVYVGGQLRGLTTAEGFELIDLEPGTYLVRLEKLGRDPIESTVEIVGGDVVEVSVGTPASPSAPASAPDDDRATAAPDDVDASDRDASTAAAPVAATTTAVATVGDGAANEVGEITGTRTAEVAPPPAALSGDDDAADVFTDDDVFSQQPQISNVAFGYRARGDALSAGGAVTVTRERGGPTAPVMVFWCRDEVACTRSTQPNFSAGSYRFRVSCRVEEGRAEDAHDVFLDLDAASNHAYLLDVVWDGDGRQPCTASIVDVTRPTE
jgi:hypothetical protein